MPQVRARHGAPGVGCADVRRLRERRHIHPVRRVRLKGKARDSVRTLKEIRKERHSLSSAVLSCPKSCVRDRAPDLWCQMCETIREHERLLAWVCEDTSIFDDALDAARAAMKREAAGSSTGTGASLSTAPGAPRERGS